MSLPSNPSIKSDVQAMTEHPEWVHKLAYQLWAFSCNQNISRVAEHLNNGTYRDDGNIVPDDAHDDGRLPVITITRQAVNNWKNREGWNDRWVRDIRDLAPQLHQQVAANLTTASLSAAEFYTAYLAGEIKATDQIEAKENELRFKMSADILNRVGHMPHNRPSDNTAMPGPKVDHKKAIASKSREEKQAMAWGTAPPEEDGVIDV